MRVALAQSRVLVCGSRHWPWPRTVDTALDRLTTRHGARLVVIEGAATGADSAAHQWCLRQGLQADRHRCYPVDWPAQRRARPNDWRQAGPERNSRMLLNEHPQLIIAFHEDLMLASGGTSDMCLRGLVRNLPVWHIPGKDVTVGQWLRIELFPPARIARVQRELGAARPNIGTTIF
jgi:hypothetical protein